MSTTQRVFLFCSLAFCIAALSGGCGQYPYESPLPGSLQVRIKTVSGNIPYSQLNQFPLQLTSVRAVRSDAAKVEVYDDLRAIRRDPSLIDAFSADAFDSSLVIGDVNAPPGSYVGLDLILQPAGIVVLDGYRVIPVQVPLTESSFIPLRTAIQVEQVKNTVVVVTFDVDSALTKGAETFKYRPFYYISSISVE